MAELSLFIKDPQTAVEDWNQKYPEGTPVRLGGSVLGSVATETGSKAFTLGDQAVVRIKGMTGAWALDRVFPVTPIDKAAPRCYENVPGDDLKTLIRACSHLHNQTHGDAADEQVLVELLAEFKHRRQGDPS